MPDNPSGDIVRVRELYNSLGQLEGRLSAQLSAVETRLRDAVRGHEERHKDGVSRLQFGFTAVIAMAGFLVGVVNAIASIVG